ncbi:MAG TPA: FAD-binding oxidoreductase [Gemmataceae bacterium]|nr:FAD-binding oxidoreductase [Gemmataceae bacterium]
MEPTVCQIDDLFPAPVIRPESVSELSEQIRSALASSQAVYPLGGQTMLDVGLPPTRPGMGLDLRSLDQVIDYPARDMTITVQAGIPLANLQQLLATENQRLPIDVPLPDRATLGGTLAVNMSGPRRYGFGTLRDYVLGIRAVNDQGQEIKAGGRVVKNVAGYDLCKLYIGSLGTLGILTQVTLKLKPRSEEQAVVLVSCGPARLESLLEEVHRSRTRPMCLDLLNRAALLYINQQQGLRLPEAPWLLVIGFEDNRPTVEWQVQQILQELCAAGIAAIETRTALAAEPLWQVLTELPYHRPARLTFKANVLPRTVAAFCLQAEELPGQFLLQAHSGDGIVLGRTDKDLTLEQTQTLLNNLQGSAWTGQGNVILLRCPTEWKRKLPVWGAGRGDGWLMRAVKEKLDPRGLFNPGRFVDGL